MTQYICFRNVMSRNEKAQEAYIELEDTENLLVNKTVFLSVERGTTLTLRYCGFADKTQNTFQQIKIVRNQKNAIVLLK